MRLNVAALFLAFVPVGFAADVDRMSLTVFEQFRASHSITRRVLAGNEWNAIVTGKGNRTVVILPGGGGDAESMFPVVIRLESKYRVIAVGYPVAAKSARELVE